MTKLLIAIPILAFSLGAVADTFAGKSKYSPFPESMENYSVDSDTRVESVDRDWLVGGSIMSKKVTFIPAIDSNNRNSHDDDFQVNLNTAYSLCTQVGKYDSKLYGRNFKVDDVEIQWIPGFRENTAVKVITAFCIIKHPIK